MRVLLVCSGGMSSAIVVQALQREAERKGLKMEVSAVGAEGFAEEVSQGWDIALVAPQVRHRLSTFEQAAANANVPCALIPPTSYTPFGSAALLTQIETILGAKGS